MDNQTEKDTYMAYLRLIPSPPPLHWTSSFSPPPAFVPPFGPSSSTPILPPPSPPFIPLYEGLNSDGELDYYEDNSRMEFEYEDPKHGGGKSYNSPTSPTSLPEYEMYTEGAVLELSDDDVDWEAQAFAIPAGSEAFIESLRSPWIPPKGTPKRDGSN